MLKKLTVVFLILAALPLFVYGQSIGKIAGVATDAETGEPLPGVNVLIEGTTLGSASDIDGYYVILNVPVGVYKLRASYIGYREVLVENVRVSANITTEVNFEMAPTTLELEEAVVVTAERPLVEKHVTQSISLFTSEEIENIPVRGLNELLSIQNSVVVQNGNVHIRGGRDDEVGYYLDGAPTNNLLNNTPDVYVIQEALEEFQVLAGGYTAEFGGANSGIIRGELKTGGTDYHASVDFQTDKFASEGEQFLNTYSYRHHVAVATVSGPLMGDKVRFFLAGETTDQGDRDRRFSRGFSIDDFFAPSVPADQRFLVDTEPASTVKDTIRALDYPDGFTPNRGFDRLALNGTLSFDYSPLKVRLSGSYTNTSTEFPAGTNNAGRADRQPVLAALNERTTSDEFNSLLLSSKLTYILSPTTFVDGRVSYFSSTLEREDSYFGEQWWLWYDSTAVARATNNQVTYRERWRPQFDYRLNGFPFMRNGDPSNFYRKQKQNYISGAVDFVSQFHRNHELKVGGEVRKYTMRRFEVTPSAVSIMPADFAGELTPQALQDNVDILAWKNGSRVNNYGFDIWGNEADSDEFMSVDAGGAQPEQVQIADAPREPVFIAFYVQDKIEFNDLIINAGLRLDVFDTDDRRLKDPANPDVNANLQAFDPDAWEEVDAFTQLSPRLGVSFPVTDRTVFYLQYGKFIQMPEFEFLYAGSNRYDFEIIQSGFSFQNPFGFGIDPIRTTSYEIGFRQQLSARAAIDITGFYKNVKGQVQIDRQFIDPGSALPSNYNILQNTDFATTKGLEFRLTLRRVNRLQTQFNYTLTDAEGTGSNRTSFVAAIERSTDKPTYISPLDFSQQHVGSVILDYRFGRNDGGPILQQLGANLLFSFSSGHAYTRANPLPGGQADAYTAGTDYMLDTRSRKAAESIGASTTPWTFNMDVRLDKTFNVMNKLQATVYARINNLFNIKNEINVFEKTGSATDDGFISDPSIAQSTIDANGGDTYVRMYRIINVENGQAYWHQLNRQLFDHPRQIFFGIKLTY